MRDLSAELEFLFRCLHHAVQDQGSSVDRQSPPALTPPPALDWPAFLALAQLHGILAAVYPLIAPYAPEDFAAAVGSEWVSSLMLCVEFESVLDAFASGGIDVMPLKGPALAEDLYGDVTARRSVDLDLLVRSRDYARAEALLLQSGFNSVPSPTYEYHWTFQRDGTTIELHTLLGVPEDCPFDIDGVWSRSVAATFRGRPMRSLQEEDLILYLCYHCLKHEYIRLLWIGDLGRALLRAQRLAKADSLLEKARIQGMEMLILCGCATVAETISTALPAELTAALAQQPSIARAVNAFLEMQFGNSPQPARFPQLWSETAKIETGPSGFWRSLRRLLPTKNDRSWGQSHHIPGPLLVVLLPVIRPIRILHTFGFTCAWEAFLFGFRRKAGAKAIPLHDRPV